MKTIYLLIHKPLYGRDRKILRAFEIEADAQDNIKLYEGIITGTLEVEKVEFVTGARLPDGWKRSYPDIFAGVGVPGGRAELP